MTLGEIIAQSKYGELRSIAVKDDNYAITAFLNLALVALYSRFNIATGEQIIDLKSNISEYKLDPDVMVIEGIFDENGDEFDLNNTDSLFSINQISFDTIQVSNTADGASISVIYKSLPPVITYSDSSSLNTIIPLPTQLIEPLLHYIGYKGHSSVNGDIKAENNTHYMRYEASCREIEKLGVVKTDVPQAHINQNESISETDVIYQY